MELKTAIEILEYHQEWRLGNREDMIHEPKKLTDALNNVLFEVKKFCLSAVSCRCFMVFNPMGEDWEQMSIAFKTFEEAKAYYDRQDRKKYPYLIILAELSYNGS